jgi:hypothetical protein
MQETEGGETDRSDSCQMLQPMKYPHGHATAGEQCGGACDTTSRPSHSNFCAGATLQYRYQMYLASTRILTATLPTHIRHPIFATQSIGPLSLATETFIIPRLPKQAMQSADPQDAKRVRRHTTDTATTPPSFSSRAARAHLAHIVWVHTTTFETTTVPSDLAASVTSVAYGRAREERVW